MRDPKLPPPSAEELDAAAYAHAEHLLQRKTLGRYGALLLQYLRSLRGRRPGQRDAHFASATGGPVPEGYPETALLDPEDLEGATITIEPREEGGQPATHTVRTRRDGESG